MKLLVDKTLISYATPVVFSGFSASQHNSQIMSTFDTFDSYEPDIYLADPDLLNNTTYKALEERPHLRVCVIQKEGTEHPKKAEFKERFGNLYEWIIDSGHGDLYLYSNPSFIEEYKSDLVSIENGIKDFLENLEIPDSLVFRIFSNQLIYNKRYCGIVPEPVNKNIYKSSKYSISLNSNTYNSLLCDCYPIKPEEFTIDTLYTDKQKEVKELKEKVIEEKTNFHFVANILNILGLDKESKIILYKMKELL
jgi:hypothetical protein